MEKHRVIKLIKFPYKGIFQDKFNLLLVIVNRLNLQMGINF